MNLLEKIKNSAEKDILSDAWKTLIRFLDEFRHEPTKKIKILLPFGGGKDSAWTLAYVRIMQLLMNDRLSQDFFIDILIMLHPGVSRGVYKNIENLFEALHIADDIRVKVHAVTSGGIPVDLKHGSIHDDTLKVFREEILYTGHLSRGNGRETFCNACNFTLMNAIARYVAENEIDVVITGDSGLEIASYWKWVNKTARLFDLSPIQKQQANWAGLFSKMSEINHAYYEKLFSWESIEKSSCYHFPNVSIDAMRQPVYFSIFEDVDYAYWSHQSFIETVLGFKFYEDSFNFTESDCINPVLMAHLRGLSSDFEGDGYINGVHHYLELVNYLMKEKSYDDDMKRRALSQYQTEEGILKKGREAEEYAKEVLKIDPIQLKALVASIFTDKMDRLDDFFSWTLPEEEHRIDAIRECLSAIGRCHEIKSLHHRDIHDAVCDVLKGRALRGESIEALMNFIFGISGLSARSIHLLLNRNSVVRTVNKGHSELSELEILRLHDPHQIKGGKQGQVITGR